MQTRDLIQSMDYAPNQIVLLLCKEARPRQPSVRERAGRLEDCTASFPILFDPIVSCHHLLNVDP